MREILQNRISSVAAVWCVLSTEQKRLLGGFAVGMCLAFLMAGPAVAQQGGAVQGVVTDSLSGETLPGVNVVVEGTQAGAATDANGQYTITGVESGTHTLRATFIGYTAKTKQVEVTAGETTNVDFNLTESAVALDEVVAIGYGEQERGQLTGSVSSVDMDEAQNVAESSFEQSLQGKVAGVQVVQTGGGKPGGGVAVNIRGIGSINAESPLYVIDGVPIQDNATGQTGVGILNTLNPSDIESIDILKDASAAAIYGSRASGGVVIIETKGGQEGSVQVSLNSSVGLQTQNERYDVLNAAQYESYLREVYTEKDGDLPSNFENGERPPHDTNWQNELFRTAPIHNYNLNVSGGSEDATYSLSFGYFDEQGTMVGSGFQRYTARSKGQYSASDHVQFGGSLILSRSNISENDGAGGRRSIEHAMKQAPTVPVRDDSFAGGFGWPTTADGQDADNPVATAELIDNTLERYTITGSAHTEIEFLNHFTYRLEGGVDFRYSNDRSYNDFYESVRRNPNPSNLWISRSQNLNPLLENTLTYDQTFGDHDVSALAGASVQSFDSRWASATGQEMPRNVESLNAAASQQQVSSGISESALRSVFGRLTYNYADRYMLTANIRRDESSKLNDATDPVGIFPSLSAAWVVTEESFFPDSDILNRLKVRGGWGQIGNQSVLGNYPTTVSLNPGYNYVFGGTATQGIGQQDMANRDITWETSIQSDVGIEMDLFNEMLSVDVNYYNKTTEDLLWPAQVAPSVGLNPPFINAGTVVNDGIEAEVGYQNNFGDLSLNLSGNVTTINNEVTSLGANDQVEIITGDVADDIENVSITRVGEPVGQFYGHVADGLFQSWDEVYNHAQQNQDPNGGRDEATAADHTAPGDIRFKDINGDGVINNEDKTVIGNPIPDFTYGFSGNLAYSGVDLRFSIQGSQGNDVFNGAKKWLRDFRQNFNQGIEATNAWSQDNQDTDIARIAGKDPNSNMSRSNSRFVEDGSYLRLKTLTLGYTLSSSVTNSVGISNLRIYATARNLVTLTGYSGLEPEIGSLGSGTARDQGIDRFVYPQAKQYMVGVQLGF